MDTRGISEADIEDEVEEAEGGEPESKCETDKSKGTSKASSRSK